MRCGQCDKTTGVIFTSLPAKVKCSIDNQLHEMNEKCSIEFVPLKHGHWVDVNGDGSLWRCSECGETQCCDSNYCGECGAKMDLPKPIVYPQVEGITPTVVKMDEVEE